eukprot:653044-Pyramimonas_sp.AAC.1
MNCALLCAIMLIFILPMSVHIAICDAGVGYPASASFSGLRRHHIASSGVAALWHDTVDANGCRFPR